MLFSGLLVFIFLIIIRPQDLILALQDKPLVYILMGLLLFGWVFSKTSKKLFRCPQDKFTTLFWLAAILSTITAHWISYSLEITIETLKTAAIYFFIVTIIDSSVEKFKTVTWYIVAFMSVVGVIGILQAYGYDLTGIGMYWAGDKGVWQIRGIGIFNNPNDLAYSVVIITPFALGLLMKSKSIADRLISLILLFISLYTIYLTHSRGGMLALVFCMVFWVNYWISNKSFKRLTILFGIIIAVISFTSLTEGYRDDSSSMGRVDAWASGMSMLRTNPITGVGKDQFIEYHERDSHSSYVRAGAELGFLGLYAYLGILYFSFKTLLSAKKATAGKDLKLYSAGYIAYLSAYAVGSFFSTRTYDIIFLIVVALISVCRTILMSAQEENNNQIFKNESIWNKNVLALSILTIFIWKLFLIQVW